MTNNIVENGPKMNVITPTDRNFKNFSLPASLCVREWKTAACTSRNGTLMEEKKPTKDLR